MPADSPDSLATDALATDALATDSLATDPLATAAAYCGRCGDALHTRDHAACRRSLELEPPRYCTACRRRMVVQVTPDAWTARCVEHGERSASTWT